MATPHVEAAGVSQFKTIRVPNLAGSVHMARFTSDPVVGVLTTTTPNGVVRVESLETPTYTDVTESKSQVTEPPFVPGQFLIKPYAASSRRIDAERQVLTTGVYKRYDGNTFQATFTGRVNARKISLDYLDWNVVNQTQLRAYCVHKALGKVNEAVWDSMVDLAEIYSTYQLLRGTSDKLTDKLGEYLVSAAKTAKRDIPKAAGLIHSVFDGTFSGSRFGKYLAGQKKSWGNNDGRRPRDGFTGRDIKAYNEVVDYFNKKLLEYRYGWFPLYLSVSDALKALQASLLKATQQIKTARSRFEKTESTSKSGPYSTSYTEVRTEKTYRVEGIAYYRRTLDQRMIDLLGFKPENIPAIAWEATRLSFVWDWFLAVGVWLDAMKPEYGVELLGTTHSQKTTIKNRWSSAWIMGYAPRVNSEPDEAIQTAFDRKTGGVQALPALTGFDRMTPLRWADAAALSFKPLRRLAAQLQERK